MKTEEELNDLIKGRMDIRFMSSDKLMLITYNKCGTRFTSKWFRPPLGYNVSFKTNLNYDINTNTHPSITFMYPESDNYTDEERVEMEKMFYLEYNTIFDISNKKDILFLYRNPYQRIISGIVQEWFHTIMYDNEKNLSDYKLKSILTDIKGGNSFYLKTVFNPAWFLNKSENLTQEEINILQFLLIEYTLEYTSSFLFQTNHTNLTLPYLYLHLITNTNMDTNRIKLVNIDNPKINLAEILNAYFELDKYHHNSDNVKESNFEFKQLLDLNTYIGGNLELTSKLKMIHNRILNSLETELFFYQKLKDLPFNI